MKIALVSPYDFAYPGGVVGHISHLDAHFRRAGHEVKILAPSSSSPESLGRDNLIPIGRPIPVPSSGSWARITLSLRISPKVRNILDREQFDIVHIHEPLMPVLPITVLRKSRGVTVGTFHAFAEGKRALRYSRLLLNPWMDRLDGRIAVSEPARQFVTTYFPGDYQVIPNGIDFEHFTAPQPRPEEFTDDKLTILFVGRMEKRKGLRFLLRAYGRLKWEFPHCRLVVVGPEEPDAESLRVIAERGLQDVVLAGYVSNERLPAYYQAADIFCSPATGGESFGVVLLESMAASTPVVASNIPGYASVLADGVEGRLIEPKSEEEFAATLLTLLRDEAQRRQMGERGRLKAQRYSWDAVSWGVLNFYVSLLRERSRRLSLLPQRVVS
jgi:phosphatidylinositol alpha-mannosyltransferase